MIICYLIYQYLRVVADPKYPGFLWDLKYFLSISLICPFHSLQYFSSLPYCTIALFHQAAPPSPSHLLYILLMHPSHKTLRNHLCYLAKPLLLMYTLKFEKASEKHQSCYICYKQMGNPRFNHIGLSSLWSWESELEALEDLLGYTLHSSLLLISLFSTFHEFWNTHKFTHLIYSLEY